MHFLRRLPLPLVLLGASLASGAARAQDWRELAQDRIETIRKSDFSLEVRSATGGPVEGTVSVRQVGSAFGFGTAVAGNPYSSDPRERAYRDWIVETFNTVTPENALKWRNNEPQRDVGTFADADRLVGYYGDESGLAVRGHTLLWSWRTEPDWFYDLAQTDVEAARVELRERVKYAVGRYAGRIQTWDVTNEVTLPKENQGWYTRAFGEDVYAQMFRWAREEDPDAALYLNEVGIYGATAKTAYGQDLLQRGAPVDGLGLQEHNVAGWTASTPAEKLRVLDRLAALGLDLQLTEITVSAPTGDHEKQADQLEDVLTVAFSHPSVNAAVLWGFWDERHFDERAGLLSIDPDGTIRLNAAGERLEHLLLEEWRTRLEGAALVDGELAFRGFHGDYEVSVATADGASQTFRVTLDPTRSSAVLTLVPEPSTLACWLLVAFATPAVRRRRPTPNLSPETQSC